MRKQIEVRANENGTIVINAKVTDIKGTAVNPTTMLWTLTDLDGVVINEKEDEVITGPTSSEDIVLKSDDLPTSGSDRRLILFTYGTYTSTEGSGLPFNEEVEFWVVDKKAIT